MGSKADQKKNQDPSTPLQSEEWAEKVVAEADVMDAVEDAIAQIIAQIEDMLQIQAGEAGIDAEIHQIDHRMGKKLFREEIYA